MLFLTENFSYLSARYFAVAAAAADAAYTSSALSAFAIVEILDA